MASRARKIDYSLLPLSKANPDHAPSEKKQAQADYKVLRPEVRTDTFTRDGGRCRCCSKVLLLNSDDPHRHANIHETEEPRWKAAIDVSLRSTITLCHECHIENLEKNRITLRYESEELKCNGRVFFNGRLRSGVLLTNKPSDPIVSFEKFRAARAASNRVEEDAGHHRSKEQTDGNARTSLG